MPLYPLRRANFSIIIAHEEFAIFYTAMTIFYNQASGFYITRLID